MRRCTTPDGGVAGSAEVSARAGVSARTAGRTGLGATGALSAPDCAACGCPTLVGLAGAVREARGSLATGVTAAVVEAAGVVGCRPVTARCTTGCAEDSVRSVRVTGAPADDEPEAGRSTAGPPVDEPVPTLLSPPAFAGPPLGEAEAR
ncbi:hypothetical protein ACFV6E_33960 [Streptomyces sp. NPDC059785]|uniref:hypothetical protein n=1 Tax=unclassified Streptomyces TaxID=2593676 RepID=UPI00364626F6